MGLWIGVVSVYAYVLTMAGILPMLRLRQGRRYAMFASTWSGIGGRVRRLEGYYERHATQALERSASIKLKWTRPARFGPWLAAIAIPVWIVNVVAYGTYREARGSAVLAAVGVGYFIVSVALLGLILRRYQRGDEWPFPFIRKGMKIGRTGRRVLFGLTVAGFLIFVIWANRPL